jgi:hypothetical protein
MLCSAAMPDAQPLVFLHVPKTGGSTLVAIARRQFPAAAVASLPNSLAGARAALARQPEAERRQLRFLHGHVPFGVHTALPGAPRYLTLLRHPVARMVSVYYYALREPDWEAHRVIHERRLTLRQFIDSPAAAEFNDGQTRLLAGSDEPAPTRATLAAALHNLTERLAFVGVTERFDASLAVIRRRFAWRRVFYRRENVNRRRPALARVAPQVVVLIERRNALDLELYAAGQQWLDAALAAMPAAAESRWFPAVNRVYGDVGSAAARLRQALRGTYKSK